MANLSFKGPRTCHDCGCIIRKFQECYVIMLRTAVVFITADAHVDRTTTMRYQFQCLPCGRKEKQQ